MGKANSLGMPVWLLFSALLGCVQASAAGCDSQSWLFSASVHAPAAYEQAAATDCVEASFDRSVSWVICGDQIQLRRRQAQGGHIVLKNSSAPGTLPWQLEILRRGSYFFLTINGKQLSWANHPAGDIDCKAGAVRGDEPLVSTISIR